MEASPPPRMPGDDGSLQGTPSSSREQFRRYRKRRSAAGLFADQETPRSPLSVGGFTPDFSNMSKSSEKLRQQRWEPSVEDDLKTPKISRKLFSGAETGGGIADLADGMRGQTPVLQQKLTPRSTPKSSPFVLKTVKKESVEMEEESTDSAEESFSRFATILDTTLQGHLSFPELMLQCEGICRELADSVREEATDRHRVTEDRLMRQKAHMLHGEAASWALLWHLFGKDSEDMYIDDDDLTPSTSQQEACEFINSDQNAQLCLRVVQWLEAQASKELDYEKKHKGWYAGSYGQKLGIWRHTQRAIRKKGEQGSLVQHLDPDAPSREQARLHSEDEKLEESLLEDVWKLLLAGRLEEAQDLCRSAGQAWRAASLGGCGELGPSPSVEAWQTKGRDWSLQAVELESGPGYQRRLWKWACYFASEKIGGSADESKYEAAIFAAQCGNVKRMLPVCYTWEAACWALVRSWLDVQVDFELARLHGLDLTEDSSAGSGNFSTEYAGTPDAWPQPVVDQQPRDLSALFQKLISGDLVHDNVHRGSKDQQRLIQMDLMLGDIGHLLDLLRAWITPPHDSRDNIRLHGHPQMIRFGAHLVLALRHLLTDELKENFREKLWFVGDLILNTYAIFLFTQRREDLVGVYASQLAPHLCVELYVHMMDLRENESVPVKYKIFRSAMEYLPFFPDGDTKKGSFSDILSRVLNKSRDIRPGLHHPVKAEATGGVQYQTSQNAHAVQWLCFTPPSGIPNADVLRAELLARALDYSNLLFREFSLISLWRTTEMPVGAHVLLGHLAEPLNQPTDILASLEKHRVQENLQEFEDWREYYTFDALYRTWLKIDHANVEVPPAELSMEEKQRAASSAQQALDAASTLLQRNNGLWLAGGDDMTEEEHFDSEWLELRCTCALTSSAGSLVPDATVCTALTDALHYCGADIGVQRQLTVDVSINTKDGSLVDIVLGCLSVKGDGLSAITEYDGGLLASIMAYAVKGELPHFRVGLVLEVLRLDTFFVDGDRSQRVQAVYISQGLCRRCCLPELILRCMEMKSALASARGPVDEDSFDLLELVASKEFELYCLFSQRQLQELLQFERSARISSMEYLEKELQLS
ncbi:unnamed protein product [Calypogeia fissa]